MKTPEVIISDTSKGTRYAMAISTELKAMENRQPASDNKTICILICRIVFRWSSWHKINTDHTRLPHSSLIW